MCTYDILEDAPEEGAGARRYQASLNSEVRQTPIAISRCLVTNINKSVLFAVGCDISRLRLKPPFYVLFCLCGRCMVA